MVVHSIIPVSYRGGRGRRMMAPGNKSNTLPRKRKKTCFLEEKK
jgi:hypothetical protein